MEMCIQYLTTLTLFVTYDLHESGFVPSIDVLVESIATPILLLSLPDVLPIKINHMRMWHRTKSMFLI